MGTRYHRGQRSSIYAPVPFSVPQFECLLDHAFPRRVICVAQKQSHSSHTTVENVIHHSAGSDSGNSRHGNTLSPRTALVNICACPLFCPHTVLVFFTERLCIFPRL